MPLPEKLDVIGYSILNGIKVGAHKNLTIFRDYPTLVLRDKTRKSTSFDQTLIKSKT